MSCSTGGNPTPGLTERLPPPLWLAGPHGAIACYPHPAEAPRLHVLVSHGFGEHSGWWGHVARALQARGVSTTLFDHYHHGRSAGIAGDVADYAHLVDGLRAVQAQVRATENEGVPLVLLGHSNGGLIALLALGAMTPAAVGGVVLCSPLLGLPRLAGLLVRVLAPLLAFIGPRLRVPLGTRPWRVTSCEAIWPQYARDPLRFRSITVRFFRAMRRAMGQAAASAQWGPWPLLLLSAGDERVVDAGAINDWFERVRAARKERRHYAELRHELFNETRWEAVLADLLAWCDAHVVAAVGPVAPAGAVGAAPVRAAKDA